MPSLRIPCPICATDINESALSGHIFSKHGEELRDLIRTTYTGHQHAKNVTTTEPALTLLPTVKKGEKGKPITCCFSCKKVWRAYRSGHCKECDNYADHITVMKDLVDNTAPTVASEGVLADYAALKKKVAKLEKELKQQETALDTLYEKEERYEEWLPVLVAHIHALRGDPFAEDEPPSLDDAQVLVEELRSGAQPPAKPQAQAPAEPTPSSVVQAPPAPEPVAQPEPVAEEAADADTNTVTEPEPPAAAPSVEEVPQPPPLVSLRKPLVRRTAPVIPVVVAPVVQPPAPAPAPIPQIRVPTVEDVERWEEYMRMRAAQGPDPAKQAAWMQPPSIPEAPRVLSNTRERPRMKPKGLGLPATWVSSGLVQ